MSNVDGRTTYLDALRRTQWLSPAELEAYQAPLLERLLRHAALQTEFYPERLAPLFDGGDPATAPIDLTRWGEVPILKRTHVIDHVEVMRARETPPDTGGQTMSKSSGSTGRPVTTWRSEIAVMAGNLNFDRAWEAWGMDINAPLAFITGDSSGRAKYPEGAHVRHWSPLATGKTVRVLAVDTPVEDQLEWLERIRPTNVMTYPFLMQAIAELAQTSGSTLRLHTFVSYGECLTAEVRKVISSTFGCQIIDIYSAREIGPIAFSCPDTTAYHLCSETVLTELLDDDGRPVPSGAFGRVVVTPLYGYAMPFVRYDVGDYALKSQFACACGRGLPTVDMIGGRTRGRFVMPDGSTKRFRPPISTALANHLSYREMQIVQTAVDALEIRYVPMDHDQVPDLPALTQILRREFHDGLTVTLSAHERIERGPGMKFELFVSRVAAQETPA